MKHFFAYFLMLTLLLILTGCRTGPIYNITDAAIVPLVEETTITKKDVKKAIIVAGAGLGWQMKPVADGHIVGTLALRTHVAIVDINYTTESFNITYKESTNLKYDEEAKTIHKNYNGWIQNLQKGINTQLTIL